MPPNVPSSGPGFPGGASPVAQARAHVGAGRLQQARLILSRVLQRSPHSAEANDVMRALCLAEGKFEQALFYAERAYRAAPDHPGVIADYGALLAGVSHGKRTDEALPLIERAIALDPSNRQAHFALVAARFTQGRLADALAASRRALEILPGDRDLSMKLVAALLNLGLADEATPIVASALAQDPDALYLAETLCTVLNYDCTAAPGRVFDAHRNYGRLMSAAYGTPRPRPDRPDRGGGHAGGRLRVGFISPDLRVHSVGFFAEPILAHLDRNRFEVFVYDTARLPDGATARFRGYPATWRPAATLTPPALAAVIAGDALDVLVELSGLTAGHSLAAICLLASSHERRPAIVSYLGYPGSTGVPAVDTRIVDSLTDPAPAADALATERLARVDGCFVCFRPPAEAPAVTPLPAQREGAAGLTFGSFNALTKLNRQVLETWARVLEAVPGSRLLIKARELATPDCRDHLLDRCERAGLRRSAVQIVPPATGMGEHLAVYGQVDLALDTFPYCGTTTTCDALWMGVPVVSLAPSLEAVAAGGSMTGGGGGGGGGGGVVWGGHASRVGGSLLDACGLADWCVPTLDAYVSRAAAAAADLPALAQTRRNLRAQMAGSGLCDERGFASRFAAALEAAASSRR